MASSSEASKFNKASSILVSFPDGAPATPGSASQRGGRKNRPLDGISLSIL